MSDNDKKAQSSLFGDLDQFSLWGQEWQGMPEFVQEDLSPWKTLIVHFSSREDMNEFAKLVDQKLTFKTQSIWYPEAEIGRFANKRYIDGEGEVAQVYVGDGEFRQVVDE